MTFPDDYVFTGVGIPRQIGNAVPPLMAKAVGKHILQLLSSSSVVNKTIRKRGVKKEHSQECQLLSA